VIPEKKSVPKSVRELVQSRILWSQKHFFFIVKHLKWTAQMVITISIQAVLTFRKWIRKEEHF